MTKVEKKYIFKDEEELIDDVINFVRSYRNLKVTNNIPKDAKVLFNTEYDTTLIVNLLKLNDHVITKSLELDNYVVNSKFIKATVF